MAGRERSAQPSRRTQAWADDFGIPSRRALLTAPGGDCCSPLPPSGPGAEPPSPSPVTGSSSTARPESYEGRTWRGHRIEGLLDEPADGPGDLRRPEPRDAHPVEVSRHAALGGSGSEHDGNSSAPWRSWRRHGLLWPVPSISRAAARRATRQDQPVAQTVPFRLTDRLRPQYTCAASSAFSIAPIRARGSAVAIARASSPSARTQRTRKRRRSQARDVQPNEFCGSRGKRIDTRRSRLRTSATTPDTTSPLDRGGRALAELDRARPVRERTTAGSYPVSVSFERRNDPCRPRSSRRPTF